VEGIVFTWLLMHICFAVNNQFLTTDSVCNKHLCGNNHQRHQCIVVVVIVVAAAAAKDLPGGLVCRIEQLRREFRGKQSKTLMFTWLIAGHCNKTPYRNGKKS
jgi:hypothetical protein